MTEKDVYPKALEGLDLSFEESIYAIAFELEDEIRERGKDAVFSDLSMTPEEMQSSVGYCLDEVMYRERAYALRRILGCPGYSGSNGWMLTEHTSVADVFPGAVEDLKSTDASGRQYRRKSNYRALLTRDKRMSFSVGHGAVVVDLKADKMNEKVVMQVQQRGDRSQVRWPYRSAQLLQELGLNTLDEVVDYFRDFEGFVDGRNGITLMEWLVVLSVLRMAGLLPEDSNTCGLDDSIDELQLSMRISNCLKRAEIMTIADLVVMFANGSDAGWRLVLDVKYLGKISCRELVRCLGKASIDLSYDFCFPTVVSDVRALDFDHDGRRRLVDCGISTVGELLLAYRSEHRFFGLRQVDEELYWAAQEHLKRYGLISDNIGNN